MITGKTNISFSKSINLPYNITNIKTYTENAEKSQRDTELRNKISVELCVPIVIGTRWNSV